MCLYKNDLISEKFFAIRIVSNILINSQTIFIVIIELIYKYSHISFMVLLKI